MRIDELPHWAMDVLEEHLTTVIEDESATARLAVDSHPREGFIVESRGAKWQIQESLSKPVEIWAGE